MATPSRDADSANDLPVIAEPLRLELACTPAEIMEAGKLRKTQNLGGLRLLAAMVLFIQAALLGFPILAIATVACRAQFREIPPRNPWGFLLIIAGLGTLGIWRHRKQQRDKTKSVAEITAHEVRFQIGTAQTVWPWSTLDNLIESETLFVVPQKKDAMSLVFPKRVFPDDLSRDWFRSVARTVVRDASGASIVQPRCLADVHEGESVTIEFCPRYRDYLDGVLASWRSRGAAILLPTFTLGMLAMLTWKPNPQAAHFRLEMLLLLPFIIGCVLLPVVTATLRWLRDLKALVPRTVTFSELGISDMSAEQWSTVRWETRSLYKETLWSFIVWWPETQAWGLVPKRAFPSVAAMDRCREILAKHATRSTWFCG